MKQIKSIIQYVNGYMTYCKAKKIRAQEEKIQHREYMKLKKGKFYGGKSYPWSKLYHCKCGNKHPWMHGFPIMPSFNVVKEGAIYRVVCHRCFRHTKKGTYKEVVEEWNTKKGINYKKVIADWLGEPYKEADPLAVGGLSRCYGLNTIKS